MRFAVTGFLAAVFVLATAFFLAAVFFFAPDCLVLAADFLLLRRTGLALVTFAIFPPFLRRSHPRFGNYENGYSISSTRHEIDNRELRSQQISPKLQT